jgi:fructokinase
MRNTPPLYGAIEAGGTKFVCAVGHGTTVLAQTTIPTTRPAETLDAVAAFFSDAVARLGPIRAAGIGSFGPIQIRPDHAAYGTILNTPKPHWSGFNIRDALMQRLGVPVVVDTDVNCAVIAEASHGAGRGAGTVVYLTIGTGIGGALQHDGRVVGGWSHAEMGHMLLPRSDAELPSFAGVCPFHADRCAEGLASGPALAARLGGERDVAPPSHPVWELEAEYLAAICLNLTMICMPDRIILGGGVMQQRHLFPLVRRRFWTGTSGYLEPALAEADLERMIVPAGLGGDAGIIGALTIAENSSPTR